MSSENRTSMRNSIATKLLRYVFSLYLLIAVIVTLVHMSLEYRYQKNSISHDLVNIQKAFEQGLSLSMWQLNQEALESEIRGVLQIPTIVGIKVRNENGEEIAAGGVVPHGDTVGNIGININLSGITQIKGEFPKNKEYWYELFEHRFPLTYIFRGETKQLGTTVIYSSSAVVFQRIKLGFLMLILNALIKTTALWLIFLWVANILLRKPLAILTAATDKVNMDTLDSFKVDIETSSQNEFKVLEESFNRMIKNLNKSTIERKKAEEDLRANHQKFQSMVDNIGIGVALISPKMEIIEQNQKMHEWFPDVDLGMHPVCYKVFNDPPLDKACDHCPTAKTLMDGRVHESLTVTPSAGGERNFRIISTPIKNEKGQVTAAIEMVEDVTEKIKDETRLQQAQKLEAIGTLAGGIAHDFNNILGGILGYTELSKDDLPENSQADDYLNNVLTLTKRASDLVAQILTFSRQTVDIKKPGNIVPVLKESIKLLRATLPATIEIKQNIEESPAVVLSDPSSIHQIVMNLMTNASHSMENNTGIITIKFTSERLDEKDLEENRSLSPGIFVKLTVQDNGSGIDPSVINHIFDPFYTTKDVGKGTGLGLSVVHGIVTSHGGMIKVKSLPKKGTTFDVFLPKTEMKEEDVEAVFSQLFPGTGNIMFVDDEEILTNIAQRVLLSLGYTVTVSNSPLEAIEIFKKDPEQFDLVITDQSMPKMTGFDMAKRLMKLRPEIPVILCSGYNEEVTDQNIKDAGIRAYLMKPMTKAALSKVIFDVLNEKKN